VCTLTNESINHIGRTMGVLIKINGNSKTPVFRQIIDQIIELVDSEAVKSGARLPSSRCMAEKLAVNRSTVYRAYQELWALGYLESRPGSYTTVRKRKKVASKPSQSNSNLIDWSGKIASGAKGIHASYLKDEALVKKTTDSDIINFIPLSPDSRLLPIEAFRKCMNEVIVKEGIDLLQYGSPLGYKPLREFIAERMCEHSVSISSDEIMITTGAQNAIDLLLKLLTRNGTAVAVEAPTYSRVIDILHLNDLKIIEVPMNAEGMDLNALESILFEDTPAILYTMPNFHNPTGITTEQGHRERLLGMCERHGIPLVEDGFEEEMKYFGKAVLPIKSMDNSGVVIYIGTFSKILFPGLRIGWIVANTACIDRLAPIQRASIISGNLLDQAALYRFCSRGHYGLHIKKMHRVYRKRMQKALKSMQMYLNPDHIEWTQPAGGYTIWLLLKGLDCSEDEIVNHLMDQGVAVLPGSTHFCGTSDGIYSRISIAHLDESAIEEGIRRLGAGFAQFYKKHSKRL
jgi:DNA-binding transcriptional MocR family regulator